MNLDGNDYFFFTLNFSLTLRKFFLAFLKGKWGKSWKCKSQRHIEASC